MSTTAQLLHTLRLAPTLSSAFIGGLAWRAILRSAWLVSRRWTRGVYLGAWLLIKFRSADTPHSRGLG
jgi:hypothetical protein